MNEYYLFLDEPKPNTNFKNFTLGGYTINKQEYESKLKPKLIAIKKECFNSERIILHEIDIRKGKGEFIGRTKEQYELFFQKLGELFEEIELHILAVSINNGKLQSFPYFKKFARKYLFGKFRFKKQYHITEFISSTQSYWNVILH